MAEHRYLVTGANVGLGKETVRQLASLRGNKVYLACRSSSKAKDAVTDLVSNHNGIDEAKLQYLHFDASGSYQEIAKSLPNEKIDGIIMNAGGWGHDSTLRPTEPNGVLPIVQINLIGHLHLMEALAKNNLLQDDCRIIYSGSEGARGVFDCVLVPGASFENKAESIERQLVSSSNTIRSYCTVKGLAALYFAAYARRNPKKRVLTVSPGGTLGTAILNHEGAPFVIKILPALLQKVLFYFLLFIGVVHSVEVGAKRYVDAVLGKWDDLYPNGTFLASAFMVSGRVGDQSLISKQYGDVDLQETVYKVLQERCIQQIYNEQHVVVSST